MQTSLQPQLGSVRRFIPARHYSRSQRPLNVFSQRSVVRNNGIWTRGFASGADKRGVSTSMLCVCACVYCVYSSVVVVLCNLRLRWNIRHSETLVLFSYRGEGRDKYDGLGLGEDRLGIKPGCFILHLIQLVDHHYCV